ncbi:hypothetical protein DSL72_005793 [Monilinia vaccinii-corymbosi]|uniref:Uncharacterized protein n=1 Tax=Monilinia vaccinii-corymbosi TaxID=61207 RepID=A0A8A3PGQ4_9HELO|nr:hypothetical protein DSL72_005793 [Monilinia vaccinii-corymbosi]
MEQRETPASNSRKPMASPFAGGMTPSQLERVLQMTPQMTRFNPSRKRLQAFRTPDSRTSKGEVTTGVPGGGDKVAANPPKLTATAQSLESLIDEDLENDAQEITVAAEADDVQEGDLKSPATIPGLSYKEISQPKQIGETVPTGLPVIKPKPSIDGTSDNSQESASLEQLIRTAPRTSNSQVLHKPWFQDCRLSFGSSRLVRRTGMDSNDENSDNDEELSNIDIAILGLADGRDSSQPTGDSGDAGVHHTSQKNKKEKKRPRRLPVGELYLVSEKAEDISQEKDYKHVQSSAELPGDPISQDASDAVQVVETVFRPKRERKAPQTWNYGAFGKIDSRAYRFPTLHDRSPRAEADNRREANPSYSDGFVGSEANPTGKFMLVPKQKRVSVSMWGLTTRVGQLDLVCEKDYGPIDESNGQARRVFPVRKPIRPLIKKTISNAPVLIEVESQVGEKYQAQQIDQCDQGHRDKQGDRPMQEHTHDDENTTNVKCSSPLPQKLTVSGKVRSGQRVEVDQLLKTSSLDSCPSREHAKDKERRTSSGSQGFREMKIIRLRRYHHESDSEEEESSVDESGQSSVRTSSDDDESRESDEASNDSDEEMDVDTGDENEREEDLGRPAALEGTVDGQGGATELSSERESSEGSKQSDEEMAYRVENEYRRWGCFNLQAPSGEQVSSQIYATRISTENHSSEVSEQSTEGYDTGEKNNYSSDGETALDEQVGDEGHAIRNSTEELSQCRETFMEPFEDLTPDESQIARAETGEYGDDNQPSQPFIAMSLKSKMAIPEADIWRPRKPVLSGVMNETREDIVDSPSPASDIAKRRSSTGLQLRKRRTFSSRPLALTTCRPNTPPSPEIRETQVLEPEIPETQITATRDMSPELGGSTSQASDGFNYLENPMRDELLDKVGDILPHYSQLSFVPEEIQEENYFDRASQPLKESYHTPKSRAKSTPYRYNLGSADFTTPAAVRPSTGDTSSLACGTKVSPKSSQLSYAPTPRPDKSLSSITRKASFALGTLPASVRRKRAKTLAFIPPFKKARLGIW